jgi:hypothetical protein
MRTMLVILLIILSILYAFALSEIQVVKAKNAILEHQNANLTVELWDLKDWIMNNQ